MSGITARFRFHFPLIKPDVRIEFPEPSVCRPHPAFVNKVCFYAFFKYARFLEVTLPAVDLGIFHEIVFEHDEKRKIEVDLTWSLAEPLMLLDSFAQKEYQGNSIRFETSVGLIGEPAAPAVHEMKYPLGNPEVEGIVAVMRRTEKREPHTS